MGKGKSRLLKWGSEKRFDSLPRFTSVCGVSTRNPGKIWRGVSPRGVMKSCGSTTQKHNNSRFMSRTKCKIERRKSGVCGAGLNRGKVGKKMRGRFIGGLDKYGGDNVLEYKSSSSSKKQ
ncbi:unnamed protein product [Ectocarpus sp. 12 AP-2014]